MNKITFPLKQRMQSAAVADLQEALKQLLDRAAILANEEPVRRELSEALKRERATQSYDASTRRLVTLFQDARRLQASGEVDEATATALNTLLDSWGLFEKAAAPKFHVVSGEVRREDGLPLHGMTARAFHDSDRLGEDTTDAEGRYTIRYELLPGVDGINLRVSVMGDDGEPLQSSDAIRNAKSLEIIDLTLPMARKPAMRRRIEGQIMMQHGLPATHLKLRLYRVGKQGGIFFVEAQDMRGPVKANPSNGYNFRFFVPFSSQR